MDFLFDNPLASMYGPYFLIFYSIFNVITLLTIGVLKNRLDKTAHLPMPPIPSNPDAFEIAYLRGGENELTRAVVFSLVQKNRLKITTEKKTSRIYTTETPSETRNLKPIEQAALGWFETASREAKEIFQTGGLAQKLRPYFETYQAQLEIQNFVPDAETRESRNHLVWRAGGIVLGLGLYKIIAAVLNGYTNVWGTIIIGVSSLILIAWAGKLPRLTKLGKAYLKRLQLAFDQLKSTHQNLSLNPSVNVQPTFAAVDPLLLSVGVFGGSVLAGTMYSDYNQAFQKAQYQAGGNSSCGSGCGSSSCSSGGDGGGGGCGGCGGGCGG